MTSTETAPYALIVDDEADIRELVEITLARMSIKTLAVANLTDAKEAFNGERFDLCLTDMRLPDGDGLDLVSFISDNHPHCPVAVITAYGSADSAVASLKAGAFDFVSKPIDVAGLRALVAQALKLAGLDNDAPPHPSLDASPRLIGNTPSMQQLRETIGKLARSQAPVYITGESGTGKELVARMIHAEGPRMGSAFVPVNCGAIPSELMESEFFGYVRGAFTGAMRDTSGLFARADGGTLFLDEVADLPLTMQVKLLRAIQERAIRPVGANDETAVDVRVICATHRDLAAEVARGRFREDLYYRLNVIEVHVPPLRERRADIAALAGRILEALSRKLRLRHSPTLAPDALEALEQYTFPGNIRELENILERAVTLSEDAVIERQYLRLNSPLLEGHARAQPAPVEAHPATETSAVRAVPALDTRVGLETQLEALERERIQDALETCHYNKTKAAKHLGITFRALRYRLAKLGMN
ncbi:Type 4 fimbriae expression regulatory protein PilR [Salinisphaera shabanensis E1L3A]|uniref:Type 4 fimbriae expression regulatory protein PilR n=1 Tax=Salinisphaera shabanensis E1L3A TaxID=1033802 RepID=U2ESH4_9GAMM|nr:sigma-54 dependent transcriptional regulator [Salinisphaera shabanensis]ERJ20927.1 Type 4 fimbriae expression regulatory protein PilR [Salinisphaera shabanensis E1L3A]